MVLKATPWKKSPKQSLPKSLQKQPYFKIGVPRNFPIFTGKYLWWSLFLTKLQFLRPATIFKRDFNAGVFLWILRNFYEQLFYWTPPVASIDLLFLIKNNVGWFLLKSFEDLVRVRYLQIISINHSHTRLRISLQKTKTCPS